MKIYVKKKEVRGTLQAKLCAEKNRVRSDGEREREREREREAIRQAGYLD